MKIVSLIVMLAMSVMTFGQTSFYDLKATDINGEEVDFSIFKGKKVLVVNTASECGFTPQYADLQKLHKEYGGEDFVIIGFPSNDFMGQEPGTEADIKAFCEKNYGVEFMMMSKITVKGDDMHPVYKWLTQKALNGVMDSDVKWNFQKYLISAEGELVDVVGTRINPLAEKIIDFIKS